MHGKSSEIAVDAQISVFKGLLPFVQVGRYHSLAGRTDTLPGELEIIAKTFSQNSDIMAAMHKSYPVFGLQFHPESILTPCGETIISNFLSLTMGDELS